MNKNITALLLIVLSVGIYFTITQAEIDRGKVQLEENNEYVEAIENAKKLIELRNKVEADFNNIGEADKERLNRMIPSTTNNINLIVDLTELAAKHNVILKNIRAEVAQQQGTAAGPAQIGPSLGIVKITFSATANYEQIQTFMIDIERSLRIMDISRFNLKANDQGVYEYQIELRTYWLKI